MEKRPPLTGGLPYQLIAAVFVGVVLRVLISVWIDRARLASPWVDIALATVIVETRSVGRGAVVGIDVAILEAVSVGVAPVAAYSLIGCYCNG